MPAVTRIGDADVTHCSGMTRAAGSSNVFCNGIGVSRQGDNNTTHLLPPNVPPCPSHFQLTCCCCSQLQEKLWSTLIDPL